MKLVAKLFRQKYASRVKKLSAFLIHYYMNRTDKSEEMDNFISGITRSLIGDRTTVVLYNPNGLTLDESPLMNSRRKSVMVSGV